MRSVQFHTETGLNLSRLEINLDYRIQVTQEKVECVEEPLVLVAAHDDLPGVDVPGGHGVLGQLRDRRPVDDPGGRVEEGVGAEPQQLLQAGQLRGEGGH